MKTTFDHTAISEFYKAGNSLTLCQAKFGCSYRTVKRAVLKSGKLRSISEGVRLRNEIKGRPIATQQAKLNMSAAAIKRFQGIPKVDPYRLKRGRALHPRLGVSEKTWFRMLMAEKNFTCSVTKERGVKLAVHHKYDVKTYPHLRWNSCNVVVVRKDIHQDFHYRYMGNARKSCTPSDWAMFLYERGVVHES